MIKVADIDISKDNCGLYTVLLKGADAQFFRIINNELWFILSQPNICKSRYTVTVSVEDLAGRFTPKIVTYTLNANDCSCTTTTTTTTTIAGSTINQQIVSCNGRFLTNPRGVSGLLNYGTFFTGFTVGSISGSVVYGDNTYGYVFSSDIRRAVVHAGILSDGQAGNIKIALLGNRNNFPRSFSNNIQTEALNFEACAIQLSLISLA